MTTQSVKISLKAVAQINFEARARGETQTQVIDRWMRERSFSNNLKKLLKTKDTVD